jgi:hypothetical protein
MTSQNPED